MGTFRFFNMCFDKNKRVCTENKTKDNVLIRVGLSKTKFQLGDCKIKRKRVHYKRIHCEKAML